MADDSPPSPTAEPGAPAGTADGDADVNTEPAVAVAPTEAASSSSSSSSESSDADEPGGGGGGGGDGGVDFGSSSSSSDEEEEARVAAPVTAADAAAAALMESSSEDEAAAPTRQVVLPKLQYNRNIHTKKSCVMRFPNAVAVRTEEFQQDDYDEEAEEAFLNKRGKALAFKSEAVIRWKYVLDEHGNKKIGADGKPLRESNTRVVEWSDGSRVMYIGNQAFLLNLVDLAHGHKAVEHGFIFAQQGSDYLEAVDSVQYRAVCSASKAVTDRVLTEIRQSTKRSRTSVAHVVTPLEKDQERRAKEVDELERQRKREGSKKGRGSRAALDPRLLEEGATAAEGYTRAIVQVSESEGSEEESAEESDASEAPEARKRTRGTVVSSSSSSSSSSEDSDDD